MGLPEDFTPNTFPADLNLAPSVSDNCLGVTVGSNQIGGDSVEIFQ